MASGTIKNPYKEETISLTLNTTDFVQESWGVLTGKVIGGIAYIYASGILAKNSIPAGTSKTIITFAGLPSKIALAQPVLNNETGGISGRAIVSAGENKINGSTITTTSQHLVIAMQFPV